MKHFYIDFYVKKLFLKINLVNFKTNFLGVGSQCNFATNKTAFNSKEILRKLQQLLKKCENSRVGYMVKPKA